MQRLWSNIFVDIVVVTLYSVRATFLWAVSSVMMDFLVHNENCNFQKILFASSL